MSVFDAFIVLCSAPWLIFYILDLSLNFHFNKGLFLIPPKDEQNWFARGETSLPSKRITFLFNIYNACPE